MKCPIDKTELTKTTYENLVEIETCHTCAGSWLDKGELEKIQDIKINDYTEALEQIPNYVGKAFSLAVAKAKPSINCPECEEPLERKEYGYCSQILIDSCIKGHGVWLDKGELQALEVFYEKSKLSNNEAKIGFLASLKSLFKV